MGELLSTGESITRLSTSWKHRCGKCGHEDWADATYPRVAYLTIDAILYLRRDLLTAPEGVAFGFAVIDRRYGTGPRE